MKLLASYDAEIVDLIPDTLPFKEREEFAEKLKALRGTSVEPAQAETATPEAPPEEPTEAEKQFALANASPASGTSTMNDFEDVSTQDIQRMLASGDSERALEIINAKYRPR